MWIRKIRDAETIAGTIPIRKMHNAETIAGTILQRQNAQPEG